MKKISNSLSLIVPAYNEEELIEETIKIYNNELKRLFTKYEIIAVDDGSTDNTQKILKKLQLSIKPLKIVKHKTNLGVGKALIDGFAKAKMDYVLHNSADRAFDLKDLGKIKGELNNYDVIVFVRYDRSANSPFRKLTSRTSLFLIKLFFRTPIKDYHFVQLYKNNILSTVKLEAHDTFMPPELLIKLYNKGYKFNHVQAVFHKRTAGKSKYNNPIRYLIYLKELLIFWLKLKLWPK